jgi:uncharacterized protein (TIGR02996 family)
VARSPIESPEAAALLAAVCAEPAEDAPRLVYADWLDEHGQADRAEFIRTQIALAQMPKDDSRRSGLEERERNLLLAHFRDWLLELPEWMRRFGKISPRMFHRGFITSLMIAPAVWMQGARDQRILTPIMWLTLLTNSRDHIPPSDLVTVPQIRTVSQLGIESAGTIERGEMARLLGTGRLRRLVTLDLEADLSPDATAELGRSDTLAGLCELTLTSASRGASAIPGLLDSPHLARLTSLRLVATELGPANVNALLFSPGFRRVTTLQLTEQGAGTEAVNAIARSPNAVGLMHLILRAMRIMDAMALELTRSPYLTNLQTLEIGGDALSEEAKATLRGRFPFVRLR